MDSSTFDDFDINSFLNNEYALPDSLILDSPSHTDSPSSPFSDSSLSPSCDLFDFDTSPSLSSESDSIFTTKTDEEILPTKPVEQTPPLLVKSSPSPRVSEQEQKNTNSPIVIPIKPQSSKCGKKRSLTTVVNNAIISNNTKGKKSQSSVPARKKRKVAVPVPTGDQPVILGREALLNLDSAAFDEYVKRLSEKRTLTAEERSELKKQRRLIKNRESAQASRQRRKNYIAQLEEKVSKLSKENEGMKETISGLKKQNKVLNEEVLYLNSVIKKNPALSTVFQGMNYLGKMKKESTDGNKYNVKAAGVVLMVVLFSFGLFFGGPGPQRISYEREPIPQVVPLSGGRTLESFKQASSGRRTVLDGVSRSGSSELNTKRLEEAYRKHLIKDSIKEDSVFEEIGNSDIESESEGWNEDVEDIEAILREREVERILNGEDDLSLKRKAEDELNGEQPERKKFKENGDIGMDAQKAHINIEPEAMNWKPNTTYLLCSDTKKISPPEGMEDIEDENSPLMVAFLIPPNTFGEQQEQSESDSLIEVTCKVVDVTVLPAGVSNNTTSSIGSGYDQEGKLEGSPSKVS